MAAEENVEPAVRDEPGQNRFTITVGDEVAGFIDYRHEGDALALLHTEVDPAYEGQGLGSKLVGGALAQLRDAGTPVLPHCSFVRRYLQRHEDLQSVVPESERARFELG